MALANVGRGAAIGLKKEVTWGTAIAADHWTKTVSADLQRTIERPFRPHLYGSSEGFRRNTFQANDNAGGGFESVAYYDSQAFGNMILGALGAGTETGSGPYTTTFNPATTLPSWTVQNRKGNGTADVHEGFKVSTLSLSVVPGELMRYRVGGISQTDDGRSAASTPSFESTLTPIAHNHAGTLSWNSQSFSKLTSFELAIDNKLERRHSLGSLTTDEPDFGGFREATFRITHRWQSGSDHLHAGLLAGTTSNMELVFSGGGNFSLTITGHNVFIAELSDPVSTEGVITQSIVGKCLADASSKGIQIHLVNDTSALYDV